MLGAMPTAFGWACRFAEGHAHAEPWAWHPKPTILRDGVLERFQLKCSGHVAQIAGKIGDIQRDRDVLPALAGAAGPRAQERRRAHCVASFLSRLAIRSCKPAMIPNPISSNTHQVRKSSSRPFTLRHSKATGSINIWETYTRKIDSGSAPHLMTIDR